MIDPEIEPRSELDGEKRDGRKKGAAYQGALEAVFAILIAVGIGYFVDQRLGTSPRYLLVGVAVGFGSFVLRLWQLGRALQPPDDTGGENEKRPQ